MFTQILKRSFLFAVTRLPRNTTRRYVKRPGCEVYLPAGFSAEGPPSRQAYPPSWLGYQGTGTLTRPRRRLRPRPPPPGDRAPVPSCITFPWSISFDTCCCLVNFGLISIIALRLTFLSSLSQISSVSLSLPLFPPFTSSAERGSQLSTPFPLPFSLRNKPGALKGGTHCKYFSIIPLYNVFENIKMLTYIFRHDSNRGVEVLGLLSTPERSLCHPTLSMPPRNNRIQCSSCFTGKTLMLPQTDDPALHSNRKPCHNPSFMKPRKLWRACDRNFLAVFRKRENRTQLA